jgi:hypothetical protein
MGKSPLFTIRSRRRCLARAWSQHEIRKSTHEYTKDGDMLANILANWVLFSPRYNGRDSKFTTKKMFKQFLLGVLYGDE